MKENGFLRKNFSNNNYTHLQRGILSVGSLNQYMYVYFHVKYIIFDL